jgi:cytochrome c553
MIAAARLPARRLPANSQLLRPIAQGGSERLGTRIVELPNNPASTELRDSAATFTAFVPRGALERGRKLAMSGGGPLACAVCHGPQLRGVGDAPPIAGRSPSYLVRQLIDFKSGARAGQMSAQMQAVATAMSESDIIAAVAYAASLKP